MDNAILALLGTVVGGVVTTLTSYFLQKQRFDQEVKLKQEDNKTEFMAETTARHFLSHKSFTDRSFETLQNHLGGFEENELRKILVRAGAIRIMRDDGSEWWRLLSRMDEYIDKKKAD
ncbi:hypothetical protein [Ohtaekwangia sp.]|uniref:hypothetical protein n=1 Tax=Ohtaekwangia sp. TaxID=2066019 RepID=UPI002F93B785